ncbi:MAG: shikimate dehydrogenase [Planctomycetota bacterium]|jgi:3-dehydroquinate dehydratase/shikimate dehydrogenase
MSYLAVSILVEAVSEFESQVQAAVEQGAEAIEIRTDALNDLHPESIQSLVETAKKTRLPVIVTCRDEAEGGVKETEFSVRLSVLREAVIAGADFIDVEYENFKHPDVHSVLKAILEQYPTAQLILSKHNFKGPFEDLNIIYESMLGIYPEAIPKIVYKARHINDCFAAFDLLKEADCPAIAFAMGPAGQISRVLAKKFGGFLTFACLDDGSQTAPGQISVTQMKQIYRWDALNADTEIFGLIGNPVAHSAGPALYNACFDQNKINAVYLPFLVEGGKLEFDEFLGNVSSRSKMGFGGFSVTLPHKTHALDYANQHGDYIDNLAVVIGAVNTLKVGFNGILSAYNTDYAGATDALVAKMGINRHDLHKAKVAVIGAGGVARAVVAGLTDVGARVTIYNRTVTKAQSLAKEFNAKAAGVEELTELHASVVVNCTSLGMHPNVDTTPLSKELINGDMTVFDTVYNPLETRLLKEAKEVGAAVVDGAEMFIRQAMAQYRIYIGEEPDEELMRAIVHKKLAGQ